MGVFLQMVYITNGSKKMLRWKFFFKKFVYIPRICYTGAIFLNPLQFGLYSCNITKKTLIYTIRRSDVFAFFMYISVLMYTFLYYTDTRTYISVIDKLFWLFFVYRCFIVMLKKSMKM